MTREEIKEIAISYGLNYRQPGKKEILWLNNNLTNYVTNFAFFDEVYIMMYPDYCNIPLCSLSRITFENYVKNYIAIYKKNILKEKLNNIKKDF